MAESVHSSKKENKILQFLQELGKVLQYPVALLPFAAVLLRFGALGITFTTDAHGIITNATGYWISWIIFSPGNVVFSNLPILFAMGVAFGFVSDHRGEAGLIGFIFYMILAALTGEKGLPGLIYGNVLTFSGCTQKGELHHWSELIYVPNYDSATGKSIIGASYVLDIGVFGGIFAGVLSAWLYKKFKGIVLPQALSFFSGRRFAPMVALVLAVPVGFAFSIIWPWIQWVLMKMGTAVADPENPKVAIPGTALYAFLNRILLPFGLHQILNTFFWFQLPINGHVIAPITGKVSATAIWVNGDINAFVKGVEGSGLFQAGFFPIMMGGLPAAAIAMIFAISKDKRKKYIGFFGGVAAVSIISGITEPIEFSFVFISPILWLTHAVLTAIFVAVTTVMRIQVGFGFSAGLIDYCASFAQSWGFAAHNHGAYRALANPLWVLVLISGAAAIYYFVFYTLIVRLNVKTPGREDNTNGTATVSGSSGAQAKPTSSEPKGGKYEIMAQKLIKAIGRDNIRKVDMCTTRLRLEVKDASKIDDAGVKAAGTYGIKKLTNQSVQIVVGLDVQHVCDRMQEMLKL